MQDYQSLSHSRWDCKYHVVFIPKKRKKRIFGALRPHLGEIFRELARQKESQSGFSRVKAQLRSREILVGEPETSRAKYFGREATLSRRSDWMRRW